MLLYRQNFKQVIHTRRINQRMIRNMKHVLEGVEKDCVGVSTDGSALGNLSATGAGAVLYLNGLQSKPIGIKKGIWSIRNNY